MSIRVCDTRVLGVVALALFQANTLALPQTTNRTAITFESCSLPDVPGPVLCGSFAVPEDRERHGRTIPLNIAVLKATGSSPKADPIVPLQGGPGQGAVNMAAFYSRTFASLRVDRNIVLIDVRGTGRSNPLTCDIAAPDSLQSVDLLPPAAISACRKALESRADLRLYTTAAITRDLDDVRRAMRIDQWNLYGTSYGTRLAQEYIRSYGQHVRTATLKGIAPPSLAMPLPYARDAQRALDATIDAETRAQLVKVLAQLRARPAALTHDGASVTISEGLFAEAVRNLLYNPASAPVAALMIQSGGRGDFAPAAETLVRLRRSFSTEVALGMFLSVTCSEDIPRIDAARIDEEVHGTFLGDYRIRQQMAACRSWTAGARVPVASSPVTSRVPVLLFSGDVDPVTPPRFGDEVVRTLVNGRHIVLKNNGHAIGNAAGCVAALMKDFIDNANVKSLDPSCATQAR